MKFVAEYYVSKKREFCPVVIEAADSWEAFRIAYDNQGTEKMLMNVEEI